MEGDLHFGHFDPDRMTFQDDNRSAFLKLNKPYLLYFWHCCDAFDILQSATSLMAEDMTASSDNIPITSGVNSATKRKQRDAEKEKVENIQLQRSIANSFKDLSTSALRGTWIDINKQWMDVRVSAMQSDSVEEKEFWEAQADELEKRKAEIEQTIKKNSATAT